MNEYQIPFRQEQVPPYNAFRQIQDMFPQPQGSVYQINTPTEIGNVPIGSTGLSVAICFPQQLMYIKSFQNGSPVIMAFRIAPYSKEEPAAPAEDTTQASPSTEDRLNKLEQQLSQLITSQGGKFDGLL